MQLTKQVTKGGELVLNYGETHSCPPLPDIPKPERKAKAKRRRPASAEGAPANPETGGGDDVDGEPMGDNEEVVVDGN